MSSAIQDIRSLPLFQIIGAPLLAIIQAEAQAAQTALEYIERVGFAIPEEEGTEESEKQPADIGKLRMAKFTYKKLDENGEVAEFSVSVPVLSLVPIPMIQIREARVEFSVKITDVKTEEVKTSINPPVKSTESKRYVGWLQPARTEFRASMSGRSSKDTKTRTEGTYELDIEVTIEKADFPTGLNKILEIMDHSIQDTKSEG